MTEQMKAIIQRSIDVKTQVMNDDRLINDLNKLVEKITDTFRNGGKVLFCGNGGSAADAQHLAAEFSGRFYSDRDPLPSEALHCNTSYLTAVANDYGYEFVYSRLLKGMAKTGDILIGLSTSGNSTNILNAFEVARQLGVVTVGFTGLTGGKMAALCDILINIPSEDTPRIQESHIMLGHIACELVEKDLF